MHLRLFGKFIFPKIILTFFTKTNHDEGLKTYKDEIHQGWIPALLALDWHFSPALDHERKSIGESQPCRLLIMTKFYFWHKLFEISKLSIILFLEIILVHDYGWMKHKLK